MKRKVPRIGDIVELQTKKGFAYAQYSHEHEEQPRYGSVLRVLPGFFSDTPADLPRLVSQAELFSVLVPLKASLRESALKVVGSVPVPEMSRPFPTFRSGVSDPPDSAVKVWFLWNGGNRERIGELGRGQRSLSILEIVTPALLAKRLEEGWTPENDPR